MLLLWQALFFGFILLSSVSVVPLTFAQVHPVAIFQFPKKQVELGLSVDKVECNEGLVLMKKLSDKSPACVKPQTAQKLVDRGWGMIVPQVSKSEFITKEDALNIVQNYSYNRFHFVEKYLLPTQFGFLKYNGTKNGDPTFIVFTADPITKELQQKFYNWPATFGKKGGTTYGEYFSSEYVNRYVWIVIFRGMPSSTSYFVDARNGELIGSFNQCPMCMCLSGNTNIDTPNGPVNVKELKTGMSVWTKDRLGHKELATILKTNKISLLSTHEMIHIVLDDGRQLLASQSHPTSDGRFLGQLSVGDIIDNGKVESVGLVPDNENYTYDILPSGQTGFYWANGILVGSTLK